MFYSDKNTEVARCRPELEPLEDRWCPAATPFTPPGSAGGMAVTAAPFTATPAAPAGAATASPVDAATALPVGAVAAAPIDTTADTMEELDVNAANVGLAALNAGGQVNFDPTNGPPIDSPQARVGRFTEFNNRPQLNDPAQLNNPPQSNGLPRLNDLRISRNAGSGGGDINVDDGGGMPLRRASGEPVASASQTDAEREVVEAVARAITGLGGVARDAAALFNGHDASASPAGNGNEVTRPAAP